MTQLDRGILDAWLMMLRSGDYAQGTQYLEDRSEDWTPRWTPLGVLARILAVPCALDGNVVVFNFAGQGDDTTHRRSTFPAGVAGLDQAFIDQLVAMSATDTFATIADWIEANVTPIDDADE